MATTRLTWLVTIARRKAIDLIRATRATSTALGLFTPPAGTNIPEPANEELAGLTSSPPAVTADELAALRARLVEHAEREGSHDHRAAHPYSA